ncbi:MAG: DUF58 domain-containing protein [Thermoguttaceae bacterium]
MKLQTTICREGWYYIVVLALVFGGAMLREVNLLLMLAAMLVGPLLLSWRAVVVTLRNIEVRRKVPRDVCAGDLLVGNILLVNNRRHVGSWALVVEEQIRRENGKTRQKALRPCVLFPYLPAGQERRGTYRGRLNRRGRYRLGPLRLSTRFPFGLLRRTITIGDIDTLLVFPHLGRLSKAWAARHRESFSGMHRREQRPGPEGDFHSLREWREGDSRRLIHARSSARTDKLMVRQFEQPRNRDLAVLLDLWQPKKPTADNLENVELAVSFAATVLADLCRKGGSNILLGTRQAEPECTAGPASEALLRDLMCRLAEVEAQSTDRLDEMLDRLLGRIASGSEVVLVSTRPLDLTDATRYQSLHGTPSRRAMLERIRPIDTSSDELARYFQAEE